MRTTAPGTLFLATLGAHRGHRDPDPAMGVFLMALMAAATLLLAWDLAANSGDWSGLSAVHSTMQTILVMAAVGAGCTGAALWIGIRPATA